LGPLRGMCVWLSGVSLRSSSIALAAEDEEAEEEVRLNSLACVGVMARSCLRWAKVASVV
jgi:hypothetical protein